jgi:acid phosphatase type 7
MDHRCSSQHRKSRRMCHAHHLHHIGSDNRAYIVPNRLTLAAAIVSFLAVGCASVPQAEPAVSAERITKGPCLLRVDQDRVALMWETDVQGPWSVHCITAGGKLIRCDTMGDEVTYEVARGEAPRTAYIHKVWITGLKPGREYRYHIVGPNVRSDAYAFRTVPARTDEVRFVVYGDSRTNVKVHRQIIEQIIKHEPAFVVNVGDLVSRGDEYSQWGPQFFEPVKGLVESVPMYIAKGNHEGRNGTYERLLVPPGKGNHFGFDYGPVHYFCADNFSKPAEGEELVLLIASDARASDAPWKFVSYHTPSANLGGHWSRWRQKEVLPAFAEAGIDFVIAGHSHHYERFRPVAPLGEGHPVTYITAGGGGAPLYDIEPCSYHAYAKSIYQFCVFHVKGNRLTKETIDLDGQVIDRLELTKKDGRLDPQYVRTAVPMGGIQLHQTLYASLGAALPERPAKGRPFAVNVELDVPELPCDARLTFALRGDPAAYELLPARTVTVSRTGGPLQVELGATPLDAVRLAVGRRDRPAAIHPALWLDCHYELGDIKETISRPVTVVNK